MAMSNCRRSSAATISASAAPDAGFKKCCMPGGRFDGSDRDDYFQGVSLHRFPFSHPSRACPRWALEVVHVGIIRHALGRRWRREAPTDEGSRDAGQLAEHDAHDPAQRDPSSSPADHLLPQGEKGSMASRCPRLPVMLGPVPSIHVLRRRWQARPAKPRSPDRSGVKTWMVATRATMTGEENLSPPPAASRTLPSPITHTGRPSGGMPGAGRRLRAGVTPRSREASGTAKSRRLRRRLPTLRSQTAQACLRGHYDPCARSSLYGRTTDGPRTTDATSARRTGVRRIGAPRQSRNRTRGPGSLKSPKAERHGACGQWLNLSARFLA
jgi:hypothetical protein